MPPCEGTSRPAAAVGRRVPDGIDDAQAGRSRVARDGAPPTSKRAEDGEDPQPARTVHSVVRVRRSRTGLVVPLVVVRGPNAAPALSWEFLEYALQLQGDGAGDQALDKAARVVGMMAD